MDIDAALNELGMLSTVTDSRRQYLQENARQQRLLRPRDRNLSESSSQPTPSNSPSKGYEIVQINPAFVTSLSTGSLEERVTSSRRSCPITFGAKYSQTTLDQDSRTNRLARMKCNRSKRYSKPYDVHRYSKPYEVPWRPHMEVCYREHLGTHLSPPSSSIPVVTTPDKTNRAADRVTNSNTSTPEKNPNQKEGGVPRSRSLDELDFAKLHLAEVENHNFVIQRKEVENVSQHLQNLQVNE